MGAKINYFQGAISLCPKGSNSPGFSNLYPTMRYNALRRDIPDISQKMLTNTLRTLEEDGLVTRTIYAEVPPRVEYAITDRTRSLLPHINSLIGWAKDNMPDILRDRARNNKRSFE